MATSAVAQEPAPLVVTTAHRPLAQSVVDRFGGGELPALGSGASWRLALGGDGELAVRSVSSRLYTAMVEARPDELRAAFASDLEGIRSVIRQAAAMSLGSLGMKTRDAVRVVQALFDFPGQVALLRAMADGDLKAPEKGLELQVWLEPKPGTWLEGLVQGMKPSRKGAPPAPDPKASLMIQGDLEPDVLSKPLEPMLALLARIGIGGAGEGGEDSGSMESLWQVFDGGFALGWNPGAGGVSLAAGLRDGDAMRAMMASPAYAKWAGVAQNPGQPAKLEFTADAFRHHGVVVGRTVTKLDPKVPLPASPFVGKGRMVSYSCAAGDLLLGTSVADEAQIKAMIDRSVRQRYRRSPLQNMTRILLRMRVAEFVEAASGGAVPADSMPHSFELRIGSNQKSLFLRAKIQ